MKKRQKILKEIILLYTNHLKNYRSKIQILIEITQYILSLYKKEYHNEIHAMQG